jgi:hypothetical protein
MKKLLTIFLVSFVLAAPAAFAGTSTIFTVSEANSQAQGSGFINFNSINASSITISVQANAYGASQQGGGRNYSGHAEAVIGILKDERTVDPGADPMGIGAALTITVTKQGDGNWYYGATNLGTGVSVSANAYVSGENAVGGADAGCSISWLDAPLNRAPTITWNTAPGSVASGESYTISAHGHDDDDNLVQVNVWKNGQGFAFANGGNGTDGDSGNATSDGGPQTVTFTAQAVDSNGVTSAMISQSVAVTAANQAPSIAWNTTSGTVANGQSYTVSAHGHDGDGNLAQVNIWKDGNGFAFAAGGDGTDGDSANSSADAGPRTITYSAQAVDADGVTSTVITQTVVVSGTVNQAPSVMLDAPGSQTVFAGTSLTLSSRATDPDGNLTDHNLDIQRPVGDWNFQGGFAAGAPFQGGPVGSAGDSTRSADFTFTDVGDYTLRAAANDGSGWVHSDSVTITVVAAPPLNRAPTIAWLNAPSAVGHQQAYTISVRGSDADGNLTQVNVWKSGTPFAFAGGGSGTSGDSGNSTSDSGPQTITFTAQAVDGAGAVSGIISHTITVSAPASVQFSLVTSAGTGGAVSGGGIFPTGTTVAISATPDANHVFSGWSGDASGTANPLLLTMDRDRTVQASFTLKYFPLTTSATPGGTVTPGGSYSYGTIVTISAAADAAHRFLGWSGDASGAAPGVAVTMTAGRSVQALFTDKQVQTISFPLLGTQNVRAGDLILAATASSGLPVTFTLISGPATLATDRVQFTAPGAVSVQAMQVGDAFWLPATVTQTFNAVATTMLKYRGAARTLLENTQIGEAPPFLLEKP